MSNFAISSMAGGVDLRDQYGNGCRAIGITETMRILLENGDDILNLANEIRAFRQENKYSCAGCALAEGDWCNADEECRRNFKDDALPDLYVPGMSRLNTGEKHD